jgi:hypothetical protein
MHALAACFLALFLASTAQADIPIGELPEVARPLAYRIDLSVDPRKERFAGTTEIDIELAAGTDTLFLHGNGLAITRAQAAPGRGPAVRANAEQVHATGVVRLRFARALPAGRHTLRFTHTAPFMRSAEGLYRAEADGRWYAWTQFQAIDARRVFPGFDEPRHKTPFTVALTVPSGMKAFANTPETARTTRPGGLVRYQFAPSQPLPTYLVAMAVGDFDVMEGNIAPNPIRSRALPFRAIATRGQGPRLAFTLAETPTILERMEAYFGTPYPYEKLDVIASPIMGGAMENVGLVTFNDTLLLIDDGAPDSQLRSFGVVMAHELAHMWFGNLVTPRWWDDIWLNESFATWMGNRIALEWRPDLAIRPAELAAALSAMDIDSIAAGRPVRQPITDSARINAAFDGLTYRKGGQVIRMFERYLGEDTFRAGVRLHLERHAHGTADAEAFFQSMADASKDPRLVSAWRSFVDQEGVPLIRFTEARGGAFRLSQQRYTTIGGAPADDRTWIVPVCASSGEGSACTLLDGPEGALSPVIGTAPWVAGNADGAGYYRFDLPAAHWDRLIAAGPTLPMPEGMTAADSIWAAFTAQRLSFAQVLAAAEALSGHPDRLVATWLAGNITSVAAEALPEQDQPRLEARMRAIYGKQVTALGFDPAQGAHAADTPDRRELGQALVSILALSGRDPELRATLNRAADKALAGNGPALDPAYRGLAFAVFSEDGGAQAADRLFEALVGSQDPLFRQQAIQGLATQKDAAGAARALARFSDNRLQSLEALRLLGGLLARQPTRAATLRFIDQNWNDVRPRAGGLLGGFIASAGSFCTEADAEEVNRVFRPRLAELNLGPLDLDRPIARIRQCAALQAALGEDVRRSL